MTLVPWWCLFLYVMGCRSHIYKRGGSWNGYEFHTYPHPAKKPGVPRDTMVDVINNLGLKLLAIHNEYNENNIAISPYGALSVLVALGEGLEGDAVYEIQQAANIPHDISIIRVGLRDVHRHLKSYFIPKEGFLAGLTLNHENVTLRPEYEDILKFYGYDTISFNNALYPEPATTEKPESTYGQITTTKEVATVLTTEIGRIETENESTTQKVTRTTTEFTTTTEKSITTTDAREIATTLVPEISSNKAPTVQTTLTIPTTREISTTTALPSTEMITMESRTTEMTTTEVPTTTMELTKSETTTVIPTSTERITTREAITTTVSTTTELPTTEKPFEETTTLSTRMTRDIPPTTIMTTTELPTPSVPTTINVADSDSTTEISTTENLLTTSQNIITTISLSSDTDVDNITSIPFTTSTESLPSTDSNNEETSTIPASSSFDTDFLTTTGGDSTTDNVPVIEKESTISTTINEESTENFTNTDNEIGDDVSANHTGFGGTFKRIARTGQTNVVELNVRETSIGNTDQKLNSKRRSRSVLDYIIARYYDEHYIPYHNHRPYVPKEQLSFLVYEKYREYNINFMKYDTVLPFHYAPHLNALALSFPLDSTKYYLLLLLPVDEKGIDKLICDLRLNSSLRQIIANLRYAHVIATIPSFMLKGYVTLTPSFQKLGIRKVFEPRQADFSPMTNQQGIYVTNIEQAITVTIRNYVDPNSMEQYRNLRQYDPVHFKADHPFLYFVIDSEIHVTLMAGKIVNPLNSRIS